MGKQIYTMKNKKNGSWYNKKDGAKKPLNSGHKTQKTAIEKAKSIAKKQGLEHSIHRGDNNQIREKNSYEKDPCPPEG